MASTTIKVSPTILMPELLWIQSMQGFIQCKSWRINSENEEGRGEQILNIYISLHNINYMTFIYGDSEPDADRVNLA